MGALYLHKNVGKKYSQKHPYKWIGKMRDFILYSDNISKYSDQATFYFVILHKCRKHDAIF